MARLSPPLAGVRTLAQALLLAAVAAFAAPAQASLPAVDELVTARSELATALQTELPRELPGPCEGEQCGALEAPQPETRVRGFELDLYCRLGGEDGLSCRPRQVWLEEYGEVTSDRLVYAKARYFDPELGRFLSQDSYLGELTEPPSLHRYLYANDNPTFYTDPTGHYSWSEFKRDGRDLVYLGLAYNATVGENLFGGPKASLAAAAEVRDSLVSFGKGAGNQAVDLVKGGVGLAVQDQVFKQRLSQGLADLALTGKGTSLKQLADDTVGMGLGAVRDARLSLGLLGHGLQNPGEVLDVAATLGPKATSEIAGRATFDTGLFVAPMARGGQVATVSEAAGFANITPEAQALAEFALGVPEGAYGVGNTLPKAIAALAAPAVSPSRTASFDAQVAFKETVGITDRSWRYAGIGQGSDGVLYRLRDARTGEILKVGKTEADTVIGRFPKYESASRYTGRELVADIFEVKKSSPFKTQGAEKPFRSLHEFEGERLPWDNTDNRLGRPGPGVPGTRVPRPLRDEGWVWEGEGFVKR